MSDSMLAREIDEAIGAHGLWKMRLRTAIRTRQSDVTPHEASGDCNCKFGKWLHDPAFDPKHRNGIPHTVITRVHAEFHREAGHVLQLALDGQDRAASEALEGAYAATSEKLVRALMKWKGEVLQTA